MARTEVRIAGFGGQGVVLAGVLLGQAALEEGKFAVQNQSYGAEARGGAARSEVILDEEPILYPEVLSPGVLAALSQAALDRYLPDLIPGGSLVLDSDLVTRMPERLDAAVYSGRFADVAARELGKPIVANMAMLGFLCAVTGIVGAEAVRKAVRTGVPRGTEDINLAALDRGMRMAEEHRHRGNGRG